MRHEEGPLGKTRRRISIRSIENDEGAEAHCQVNNTSLDHTIEFDWLDDVLK